MTGLGKMVADLAKRVARLEENGANLTQEKLQRLAELLRQEVQVDGRDVRELPDGSEDGTQTSNGDDDLAHGGMGRPSVGILGIIENLNRRIGVLERARDSRSVPGKLTLNLDLGHEGSSARERTDPALRITVEAGSRGGDDSGPRADASSDGAAS